MCFAGRSELMRCARYDVLSITTMNFCFYMYNTAFGCVCVYEISVYNVYYTYDIVSGLLRWAAVSYLFLFILNVVHFKMYRSYTHLLWPSLTPKRIFKYTFLTPFECVM